MARKHIHILVCFIFIVLILPVVTAEVTNYFSVKEHTGPYSVLPGDELTISFILKNVEYVYPKNVTAYIDGCPWGWDCERQVFSFADEGNHAVNLTLQLPETAIPKKYTLYILLESEEKVLRGNDRVIVTVLSEKQSETITYDEYLARRETESAPKPELFEEPPVEEEVKEDFDDVEDAEVLVEEVVEPEPKESEPDIIPIINESEIIDSVERLESSHQFVEYASIVLIVLLVFIAAGAYVSFRKDKK